ncbi:hypothetical protein EES43_28505 [Streptomyces sp. ADI96-02]|uniref:hypothetical protein n=1 Tax=unclassified Streptomyces TaxID=2593676 RepID=UPI000F54FD12|nr:hypothetical protein [Streptomyces sp. ADI96-02]RPK54517.1 hypothetical protein EES43_28505 [Streptomyces sp. ADI96-02]
MDLSALELAVQRLRDAEAALDAARADVEMEAVTAVRQSCPVAEVSELSGLTPHDLMRMEKTTGDLRP